MKQKLALILVLASITAAMIYTSCKSCSHPTGQTGPPPDPQCATAPASWFSGPTTPAPNDYGPFVDTTTTTDCDFHLWSFQKFLSLTRSSNGIAPFEGLVQVSNDLDSLGPVLKLSDVSQAGTQGTLYDKRNRPVYYSIFVNRQMYDFQKKNLVLFASHIRQNKDTVLAPGDTVNINTLKQFGLDTLNYPVGAFEVKASWILTASLGTDSVNYYITNAQVTSGGLIFPKRVALLGMHIVGKVDNHPELVWATFEHDGLAPDYDWSTGKDTTTKMVSANDYLFYTKNTPVNGCPMNNNATTPSTPQFSSVFNMFRYGMPESFVSNFVPSHRDSVNNANIAALNRSVKRNLDSINSTPWNHYFYKGAMWLDDPTPAVFAPGNDSLGSIYNPFLRGSRAISNITMETFAQVNFSGNYTSGSINCFACHGTVDFKNDTARGVNYNLALSHLFINALLHKFHPNAPKTP